MNWRLVVVLAATLAGQLPAYGQDTSTFVFRSDDPRDCLIKPSAAAPAYPDNAASGAGGVVRAKMNFAAIEQQPRVDSFTNTAGEPFNVAVRAHLATYRLSCAALLGRQLVQEFQFVPGTATVRASSVRTNRESGDRSSCPISIPSTPRYPENTSSLGAAQLDRASFGNVLLRLTFAGPGEPGVIVLHDGGWRKFSEIATEHAARYRMTCADSTAYPVTAVIPYRFQIEGDSPPEFKSITLTAFLQAVDGVKSQRVYFDFASMACPFDIKVYPLQPTYENVVVNTTGHDEDRREFFAWLAGITVKLPPNIAPYLKGQAVKVSVPCAVLNLL